MSGHYVIVVSNCKRISSHIATVCICISSIALPGLMCARLGWKENARVYVFVALCARQKMHHKLCEREVSLIFGINREKFVAKKGVVKIMSDKKRGRERPSGRLEFVT